ncbi:MAG: LysR family transcriptional regulator [Alphaproteobacteria bacterium]|nr:LysR family transcriptional regulator [Alphaproteobacteria bacterium]
MSRPPPSPPLNALRAFETFARHGGMTAAAELCVTHGAVSRQVRALQEALGAPLVTGPRHRLVLTPTGAELAARLSTGFAAIHEAVAAARAGDHRSIEISCLGTLALKWLIPRLGTFLAAHPEIRVRLSESYAPVDFARDRFSGAIRILNPGTETPGAEVTPFLPQYQGAVAAPHVTPPGQSLDAFAALPRLHAATFPESWRVWSDLTDVALPPPAVEREFAHNHSMIEAAVAGMGVAIAPWAFVAPDIAAGRLVAPFGFALRPSQFAFLRPAGRKDPALDAFRDWLVAEGAVSPPPIPSTDPGV